MTTTAIEGSHSRTARERVLAGALGAALLMRLLFPYFDSPLDHLFSDPLRHWNSGRDFLHPDILGSSDPIMYQLWLFVLREIALPFGARANVIILTGCGALCMLMPYGWYRALRELTSRGWALGSALALALTPSLLGLYAYFMTETLLLTLTGFAFWLTLRAHRKRSVRAFAAACAVWLAACFTRIVALPMAAMCLLWLWGWLPQARRLAGASLAALMLAAITLPAGWHARAALGYFAPFGNLNLNAIYRLSGSRDIQLDYGPQGRFMFGSPSYYNPTFYPFSDWTTARRGVVALRIDTRAGRRDWLAEAERVRRARTLPAWRDYEENLLYLLFGQSWPDNDRTTLVGWASVWTRWLWVPAMGYLGTGVARRRFQGRAWILPVCALVSLLLLAVQTEGIMEGRFRKPIDPIVLAALSLQLRPRRRAPALVASNPGMTAFGRGADG